MSDDPITGARTVLAAATPGPIVPLYASDGSYGWLQTMPQGVEGDFTRADLNAIALAVNALPALLALAEAVREMPRPYLCTRRGSCGCIICHIKHTLAEVERVLREDLRVREYPEVPHD